MESSIFKNSVDERKKKVISLNGSQTVDWIQLKFSSGRGEDSYKLFITPDGNIKYSGTYYSKIMGEHEYQMSPEVFNDITGSLIERNWKREFNPGAGKIILDGSSHTLRWSISGKAYEYYVQIELGPDSILKVIKRIEAVIKEKEKLT